MSVRAARSSLIATLATLAAGAVGAALAFAVSLPIFILTGPAIFITALSLMGLRLRIADPVRDAAFLIIGIGIGAGVTTEATDAVARWPLAFGVLAATLTLTLLLCRFLLTRLFGFDRRSAVLAATPGHLSYVISLGASLNADMARIAIVQSVRLLALTLVVPFVAIAFGVEVAPGAVLPGPSMPWLDLAVVFAVAVAAGVALKRAGAPAPLLLGGLGASSLAHFAELTHGVPGPEVALPCFLILGALIGTRFTGVTLADLRRALVAGLTVTFVAASFAAAAAAPVALALGMPVAHVVIAFSPGGLETMIAMGAVLGANAGFVAACHIGRLLLLTALTPALLGRARGADAAVADQPEAD